MEETDLKSTVDSSLAANQKSLIQSIKDAVRDTSLNDSQLAAIRDMAAKVGIKSFKDVVSANKIPPKTKLEKYMLLQMEKLGTPAKIATFINDVVSSKTQEELAKALDLPPEDLEKILPTPTISEIFTSLFKKFLVTFFISFCFSFMYQFVSKLELVKKAMEGCHKFVKFGSQHKIKMARIARLIKKAEGFTSPERPRINFTKVPKAQMLDMQVSENPALLDRDTIREINVRLQDSSKSLSLTAVAVDERVQFLDNEVSFARDRLLNVAKNSPDALPLAREEFNSLLSKVEQAKEVQKKIQETRELLEAASTPRVTPDLNQLRVELVNGDLADRLNQINASTKYLDRITQQAQVDSFHIQVSDQNIGGTVSYEGLSDSMKRKVELKIETALIEAQKSQKDLLEVRDKIQNYQQQLLEQIQSRNQAGISSTTGTQEYVKVVKELQEAQAAVDKSTQQLEILQEASRRPSLKIYNDINERLLREIQDNKQVGGSVGLTVEQDFETAQRAIDPTDTERGWKFVDRSEQKRWLKDIYDQQDTLEDARKTIEKSIARADKQLAELEKMKNAPNVHPADAKSVDELINQTREKQRVMTETLGDIQEQEGYYRQLATKPSIAGVRDHVKDFQQVIQETNQELQSFNAERPLEKAREIIHSAIGRRNAEIFQQILQEDVKRHNWLNELKTKDPTLYAEALGLEDSYILAFDQAQKIIGDDPKVWALVFEQHPELDPLQYSIRENFGTGTPEININELSELYQDAQEQVYDGEIPTIKNVKKVEDQMTEVKDKASYNILCGAAQWAGFSFLKTFTTFITGLAGGLIKEYILQGALPAFITACAVSVIIVGKGIISSIFGFITKGVGFVKNMVSSLWQKILGKRKKLASSKALLKQAKARNKYAAAAIPMEQISSEEDVLKVTENAVQEGVKASASELSKFLGQRSISSLRELASEAGSKVFIQISQKQDVVDPRTPLEDLIKKRVERLSGGARLQFLSDISNASSEEEMMGLLEIKEADKDLYFKGVSTRGQKLWKFALILSVTFLLSLFIYAIVASGAWATASASFMKTMAPIAETMHSVLGYASAKEFYTDLALNAAKSALISTTILGVIMYGPSWIRKSVGAISTWVSGHISKIWSVIKKGLSYLNPLSYMKKASSYTASQKLVVIMRQPIWVR
jgi:hypothetical protein